MTLILLPNLLSAEASIERSFPPVLAEEVKRLSGLIVEDEKEARAFLKRLGSPFLPMKKLNEHTPKQEIQELLEPLLKGETWGLVSDAGLPCLADPGAELVRKARERGIKIEAIPGPSSLFLALMLSGLPAQRFAFHGYLPREQPDLSHRLKELEKRSEREEATQLFIEAPYRNLKMLHSILEALQEKTLLCVAWDLMGPDEGVITRSIAEWKKSSPPPIDKKPAVFCLNKLSGH